MTSKKPGSRYRPLRIVLIIIAVLGFALLGLHIWFIHNARGYLKQMIATKSHGKLKLELAEVSFDFFSNKIKILEADLISTDSLTQPLTYHIKFRKLTMRIHSFWPMLFQNTLKLDSIKLHDPDIEVLQWRRDTLSAPNKNNLSVPQQMGQLYKSMLDALDAFDIRRIMINNARLSLINKMDTSFRPVVISNIYFDLMRTGNGNVKRDEFVENQQNVELRTTDQSIFLPSGRHQLQFKSFNLQLFKKRVQLDSCTITAKASVNSKSSYKIFFNRLTLVGVDFNAMYLHNLIRADSVYCENPFFDINLDPGNKTAGEKKERPDLEKLVRELTGDLDLAFVGVKDAGIHINMIGEKKRSLFNSSKDNFEMRGFRINADSAKPVVVKQFDMLVRDYHLYNVDSSSAYTFDSVRFLNNKIVLNNFHVTTEPSAIKKKSERNFKIPYFELTGLDWFELIFDQNLKAEEAALYNPIIYYKKFPTGIQKKKTNLFASLQTLDDMMTLDKIKIINGQLNMNMGPSASFIVDDLNLSLYSNSLMKSTNREGLRRAVEFLSFSRGQIRLKDITAILSNISFTGENLLHCEDLEISSRSNSIKGVMHNVNLNNMLVDDEKETILLDGLEWGSATMSVSSKAAAGKSKKAASITLKGIKGNNTRFNYTNGETTVSTFLNGIRVNSLVKQGTAPIIVNGLSVNGSNLDVKKPGLKLTAASYAMADDAPSFLNKLQLESVAERDTVDITSSRVNFTVDVNAVMNKDIHLTNLQTNALVMKMSTWNTTPTTAKENKSIVRIDRFAANDPDISIQTHKNDSVTSINIPHASGSMLKVSGLKMSGGTLQMDGLTLNTTTATFIKPTGEIFGVEKGNVDLDLSGIKFSPNNGKPEWSAVVNSIHLQNPNSLLVGAGKNRLSMDQITAGNITLSSAHSTDFSKMVRANVSAWLKSATGQYIDSTTTLKWYNASYNAEKKIMNLDSFAYYPTQVRDTVINRSKYQTDYITFRSGPVKINDFSLEKYEKDSALMAKTIEFKDPYITVFRDKLPPVLSGATKPLPVDMIRKIPFPVRVKNVKMEDGTVLYTEKHPKTRAEGTLSLMHVNLSLKNIKNQGLDDNDSLELKADTYLMDSALIHLVVNESYADSLGAFLMTLRMKPTTLSFLNPVLAPLSNIIITSGTIDSLQLRAVGKNDLAFGEMKMYYHDLHIKLIKDGDVNKTTFFTRAATTLLNALLVHKDNNGKRTGVVYFERLKDRSFFNYIVKIAFSGMATSIGVKKNSRYMKQYRKELKKNNLPPIDFD